MLLAILIDEICSSNDGLSSIMERPLHKGTYFAWFVNLMIIEEPGENYQLSCIDNLPECTYHCFPPRDRPGNRTAKKI